MIVLHAALVVADGGLRLWGETAPDEGREVPSGRLPFDAGPRRLAEAVDGTAGGFLPDPARIRTGRVWLPTRGRHPVPSTPLVAPDPGGRGRLGLRPWAVSVLPLGVEETLTFLTSLAPPGGVRRTVAPGVVPGGDLRYWWRAIRFALELVAEEHVLPALEWGAGPTGAVVSPDQQFPRKEPQGEEEPYAVWRPALLGDAAPRFAELVREMPPSARALDEEGRESPGDHPPGHSPRDVTRTFLDRMTDHLVRSASWDGFEGPTVASAGTASPDAAWLRALRTADSRVAVNGGTMADLRRRWSEWRRPLSLVSDAPFRLAFRLEEPRATGPGAEVAPAGVPDADPWRLELLLQSTADPSLRIPVRQVREGEAAVRTAFGSWWDRAAELVLSSLGQAVGVSPVVEEALDGPDAAAVQLDVEAAYRFLAEDAGALEQAGFPVLLPAWWVRGATRADVRLRPSVESPPAPGSGLFSLEALVQVHWEAVLGGERLTREELERLAALKVPLVRMRGEWIQVDPEAIRRVLQRVSSPSEERVLDVLRMALEAGDEGGSGGTADAGEGDGVRAAGWVGDLLRTLRGEGDRETESGDRHVPPPEGFRGTLRPYQLRGYAWLASLRRWGLGACLADDMGLGKTVQALALIQRDREARDHVGPVLLVCPTSVITNWRREAERFTPDLPVLVHHGGDRATGDTLAAEAGRHGLVVTSYGLLHRDAADLQAVPWEGVVLDEAQNVKNPDTKQAQAARSLEAGYRVALTGTPVENHVGDLWSLMEFLNPGLLGSRRAFRERFLRPIQSRGDRAATERLRRVTGPFVLRRAKTDPEILPELPDKIERRQYCSLTAEQATLYRAVLADAEERLEGVDEGMERRGLILGLLTRLKQVCNHPAHFLGDGSSIPGRSGKLARMVELAEEVAEAGERALVFTQYVEMGEILKRHLEETFGREAPFLHGGVPRGRRDEMIERFQAGEPDGPAFFLLSLRAGGTGLNLTGASHVFHYDRWWNPAVEDQATDRAYRIGQTRNVQVHKLVCTGTLEERIDDLIEGKKEVARAVVGGGEAWITEMDDEGLRELLALSGDGVDEEAGD